MPYSKDRPLTGAQKKILAYADANSKISSARISMVLGYARSTVDSTLRCHRPDREKLRSGSIINHLLPEEKKIITDYKKTHPDMGAEAVAEALKTTKYRVTLVLKEAGIPLTGKTGNHTKKKVEQYTRRKCLGYCGRWFMAVGNNYICDKCKQNQPRQYMEEYTYHLPGAGR